MKKNEVPQDESFLSKKNISELYYVVDEDGHFTTEQSSGWEAKTIMQTETLHLLQQRVDEAKEMVKIGKISPIVYYMELNKMDWSTLAAYMQKWPFFIKRHAKPKVFNRLTNSVLQKYADVFGITLEELKNFDGKN